MGQREIDRLWNYEDPAGTEGKFRELLPAARAGGDRGYLVELLTQIGRTYSLRGKFKEAHTTLDEAEEVLGAGTGVPRVRCLLERGRTFNSAGEAGRARGLFVDAWEMARAAAEKGDRRAGEFAIDAAHMVAIAEKEPREQLAWNLKALEMAERPPDVVVQRRPPGALGPLPCGPAARPQPVAPQHRPQRRANATTRQC